MVGFRDFLTRFRPAAAPGRAAPGGVPADRSAELAAELGPPLALLEDVQTEAEAIRERAEQDATRTRREAERQAAEIIMAAREGAPAVRARSADGVVREAEEEAAELHTAAGAEAAAVRKRAVTRMPALVDRVSALVNDDLTALKAATDEPPGGPDASPAPDGGPRGEGNP
ncbi:MULTISPECIES: hypothetical protein [Streptomyces]|uniref:hypothetical protein n=1 Tax=Streptomyces TaxID=1883 RepID=UPI0015C5069A|nr:MULTISPECIES: hypothetical protein [Streptomyces]MDX3633419.1 hypothetical protein [Streptomyces europaeiscabiei]MDX3650675.1 hypothetical protein [Streptomyces europaeiscabiei]WRZ53731.1 hypothetical protein OG622_46085 [Streptomyces sp. NBC_01314]